MRRRSIAPSLPTKPRPDALALLVSGTSAYLTWESNRAKQEALRIVVRPVGDCRTEYHGGFEAGQIGLCWAVTLANESEN
jgi:hypothetical protein